MDPALHLNAVSLAALVWALRPEYPGDGLVVAICVLYLWGMMSANSNSPNLHIRTRLLSFVGLCATTALLFLGLLSPYYGIVAFFAIPAPIVFAVLIFRPEFVWNRFKLRTYLNLCVLASAAAWTFQIFWQLRTWK
jgi:hypothetical protein